MRRTLLLALSFAASACSSSSGAVSPVDSAIAEVAADDTASTPDSFAEDTAAEAAVEDSAVADTTVDVAPDAPPKFDILGDLTGACGVVAMELASPSSSFVQNTLTFASSEMWGRPYLSPGGQKVFDAENAGGSSFESETMTFEVLHHCDGAKLLKTEKEILYTPPDDTGPNNITDLLIEIAGKKVGVNPVRVYKPSPLTMTDAEIKTQLEAKLNSIKRSSERVLPADKWVKQIMHVWTATAEMEAAVVRVVPTIAAATRADTIIILTRTKGGGFLYCNPDPPLGSECPPI